MPADISIKLSIPYNVIGDPQLIKKLREGFDVRWLEDNERIIGENAPKYHRISPVTDSYIREYQFSSMEEALTKITQPGEGATIPSLPIILYAHANGKMPTDDSGNVCDLSSTVRQDVEKNNTRYWIHQVAINNHGAYRKNKDGILEADSQYLGVVIPVPLETACRKESILLWEWFENYPKDSLAATLLDSDTKRKLADTVQVGLADASETAEFSVRGLSKPGIVPVSFHYYNAFSCHYSDSADIFFGDVAKVHRVVIK